MGEEKDNKRGDSGLFEYLQQKTSTPQKTSPKKWDDMTEIWLIY